MMNNEKTPYLEKSPVLNEGNVSPQEPQCSSRVFGRFMGAHSVVPVTEGITGTWWAIARRMPEHPMMCREAPCHEELSRSEHSLASCQIFMKVIYLHYLSPEPRSLLCINIYFAQFLHSVSGLEM